MLHLRIPRKRSGRTRSLGFSNTNESLGFAHTARMKLSELQNICGGRETSAAFSLSHAPILIHTHEKFSGAFGFRHNFKDCLFHAYSLRTFD